MTALYVSMQVVGGVMCVLAVVWAFRTRRQRRLWRNTSHDTSTVAIVLELEDRVRELEQQPASATETR